MDKTPMGAFKAPGISTDYGELVSLAKKSKKNRSTPPAYVPQTTELSLKRMTEQTQTPKAAARRLAEEVPCRG